jgi:hypothetical protein
MKQLRPPSTTPGRGKLSEAKRGWATKPAKPASKKVRATALKALKDLVQ